MADTAKSNKDGGVGQDPNTYTFKMLHASGQLTSQACASCHTTSLANAKTASHASTLWAGAALHPGVASQPTGCLDCHQVSLPKANASTQSATAYALSQGANGTSNTRQWMNHGSSWLAGKDCALCHQADAKSTGNLTFLNTDAFHSHVSGVTSCAECHGTTNGGGTVQGTGNNLPSITTDSTTLTSSTYSPGLHDQINHLDANVTSHDCAFCHTPTGSSWAAATVHSHFTGTGAPSMILDTTTGRCSNCHLNIKPPNGQTTQDHSTFSSASGSEDCKSCHTWPGTGTASNPNWLGATGVPQYLSFGFNVAQPPATTTTPIVGINNLPHPVVGTQTCVSCHGAANPGGALLAIGYDHAQSALIASNCASCHEAGSNMVGAPWDGGVAFTLVNANCGQGNGTIRDHQGDTRAIGFTSLSCTSSAKSITTCGAAGNQNCLTVHFFPIDCHECHSSPGTTTVFATSGVDGMKTLSDGGMQPTSTFVSRWKFPHSENNMNSATCCHCHTPQHLSDGGTRCSG
jgi:hypothetical protein